MHYEENPYGPWSLPYQTYRPIGPTRNWISDRLIVYLHGRGDRGVSLPGLNDGWGLPQYLSKGLELKMTVISPVCPADWVWEPDLVHQFLLDLKSTPTLSNMKLILCGYSMGATGVFALQSKHPGWIHAGISIAGRIVEYDGERIKEIPWFGIYGSEDPRLAESRVKERFCEVARAGGSAELRVLDGKGHFVTEEAFAMKEMYEWAERI